MRQSSFFSKNGCKITKILAHMQIFHYLCTEFCLQQKNLCDETIFLLHGSSSVEHIDDGG